MKMKKIFAALAATAVTASAFAAMSLSAYAAEVSIPYTESAGSLGKGNEGTNVRRNIYNIWGNSVTDIAENTTFVDHVTVNFTVSGIGSDSVRKNDDGSEEQLIAFLCGNIGTNGCWEPTDDGYAPVNINGDGDYTVTWTLAEGSDTVSCLILQSNINFYAYIPQGETGELEDSGVVLTVNSITTGEDVQEQPTTEAESGEVTTTAEEAAATTTAAEAATTTTVAAAATTTTAKTTAAATTAAGATTTASGSSSSETPAQTGDAGVGVALAALATGVAVAFTVRKRK